MNSAIERFTQKPASPSDPSDSMRGSGLGVAAFCTGIGSLITLAFAFAFALPILLPVSVLAGVAAIILGAKGLKKPNRGLAIAGMVMGIVNSAALVIAAFFVLLLILLFAVTLGSIDVM